VSGKAQVPVPGIIFAAGRPAAKSVSRSDTFSLTVSEFASELVPKIASPTSCFNNQRQCLTKRDGEGVRSPLNGVRTGDITPLSRDTGVLILSFLFRHNAK
jgi:hypothetical protein